MKSENLRNLPPDAALAGQSEFAKDPTLRRKIGGKADRGQNQEQKNSWGTLSGRRHNANLEARGKLRAFRKDNDRRGETARVE